MGIVLALGLNLLLICHDREKPLGFCRRILCRLFAKFCVFFIALICYGTYMSSKQLTLEDVNYYEEYLGTVEEQERA